MIHPHGFLDALVFCSRAGNLNKKLRKIEKEKGNLERCSPASLEV
jgi:hypothetical protein